MARQLYRFPAMFVLSVVLLPLGITSRVLALVGADSAAMRVAAFAQRCWARWLVAVFAIEVVVEGTLPRGRCLIVANHLSYLDILLLGSLVPGRFVAKSDLARWPGLGQLALLAGTIWVEPGRRRDVLRVEREMERTLAAGLPVVLFPEGHSTRGLSIDRLHSSLLECAVRGRIPCQAVTLGYETPDDPWAPAATICWWGGMSFPRHAWNLGGLRRVRARVRVAATARTGLERKELAEALRRDLLVGFVPVRQGPIAPGYPWPELFAEPG